MTETVYMIRNKESGCYVNYDEYENERISFGHQWLEHEYQEMICFIEKLDASDRFWFADYTGEPSDYEIVKVEVVYREIGVVE